MIGLGHALSHSLAPQGVMTAPFVGVLDSFTDGLVAARSVNRRLLSSYTGFLCRVRADRVDQPVFDVPFRPDGWWDLDALLEFKQDSGLYLVRKYDQFGTFNLAQTNSTSQPMLAPAMSGLVTGGVKYESGKTLIKTMDASDIAGGDADEFQWISQIYLGPGEGGGLENYNDFSTSQGSYVNAYGGIYFDAQSRVAADPIPEGSHILSEERSGSYQAIRLDGSVIASSAIASGSLVGEGQVFTIGVHVGYPFSGRCSLHCMWSNTNNAAERAAALAA